MKAYILPARCAESFMLEFRLKKFLVDNNWEIIKKPERADLIIVDTCAYGKMKEDYYINKITHLSRIKKRTSKMVVVGCLPSINKKRLDSVFKGPSFTHFNIDGIAPLISRTHKKLPEPVELDASYKDEVSYEYDKGAKKKLKIVRNFLSRPSITHLLFTVYEKIMYRQYATEYYNKDVYYIEISTGCLSNCSYCAIKRARGSLKSKPARVIIKELKKGLERGFSKFVLTGSDVGAYGQDLGKNVTTLLNNMIELPGSFTIAIRNVNPKWIIKYHDDFMKVLETGKISSITVPVQSGSDKVLKSMRREYNSEDVKECLVNIKKKFPKVKVFTHIIVGFPGETEEDFKQTLDLINSVRFDCFSPDYFQSRPYTPAQRMKQVAQKVKEARLKKAWQCCMSLLLKNRFSSV